LLNASVGVQRVLARLRPVQSRRFAAADLIHRQRLSAAVTLRRVGSGLARIPVATIAALRPAGTISRPRASRAASERSIARHLATRNPRSGLAARSITDASTPRLRPTLAVETRVPLRQPLLAARCARTPARVTDASAAGQGHLARRSLVSRIGVDRAVPAAAIAIVLVATALSSAPSFGSSGPVGGPTGDGPDARIAIGGFGGVAGVEGQPGNDVSTGVDGGGVDGAIDQTGPDGGLASTDGLGSTGGPGSTGGAGSTGGPGSTDVGTTPPDQATVPDSYVDDGTLLKPVAVDTSVSDGKGLMRSYRVRAGDSLTGIAHKFGVSMMTVWWANHLTHKDDLHIGQTLTIPPVSGVVVTVGSSDTLDSLALKYGVEAAAIVDANDLQDPNLVIGQTLTVPGGLGDKIATPKPKAPRPTTTTHSSGTSHPTRPVSPPSHYGGGKFAWPVAGGYISQYFHYGHYAIDIAADRGTAVKAAAAGVVIFSGWKTNGGGYQVWISHGSGLYTTYNHMSSLSVGRGQHVARSQMVGRVGMTGNATGPHLHFEVWRGAVWAGGTRVNPLLYL
jgi:murein DD-endopeptidase MepM/ murein hydrolase activator NlpD